MTKIMKKVLIFSAMLAITLGALAACSSDDKGSDSGLAARVVGTYVGELDKLDPYFVGEVDVVVTKTGDSEVAITFSAGSIAPFKAKLTDSGVQGIIQYNGIPMCQFDTINDVLIINNTVSSSMYTFTGVKK